MEEEILEPVAEEVAEVVEEDRDTADADRDIPSEIDAE